MTQKELNEKYQARLCGLIADAYVATRSGSELAIDIRLKFRQVDAILSEIHAEYTGDQPVKPPTPRKT
jgi:hypothetical protein